MLIALLCLVDVMLIYYHVSRGHDLYRVFASLFDLILREFDVQID